MKSEYFNTLRTKLGSMKQPGDTSQPWQSAGMTLELLLPDGWPVKSSSISWCLRKDGNIIDEGETRDLAELVNRSKGAYVLAWAPAKDVLLTRINMPTRRKSRIEQALPYALEDILLKDPDSQHFTHTRINGNELAIAVIAKQAIATWVDEFREHGLPVRAILPVTLGLPVTDNAITVNLDNNHIWARISKYQGISLPALNLDQVPALIRTMISGTDNSITSMDVYNMHHDANWEQWHELTGIEIRSGHQPLLDLIKPSRCPINIMHGNYVIQIQSESKPLSQFRPAMAMTGLALFLLLAQQVIDVWQLSRLDNSLQKEMLQLYRKTFPAEKVIRDPFLQMKQKFNDVSGHSPDKDLFISLLGKTTALLRTSGNFTLSTVSYSNNKLTLNITLKDYAALDSLKSMASEHGLEFEVLSANRRENEIAGRIRLGAIQL